MSHSEDIGDDLAPTSGYKPQIDPSRYAGLTDEDDSLNRWKTSLGIKETPKGDANIVVAEFFLHADSHPNKYAFRVDMRNSADLSSFKEHPVKIKEGTKYNVGLRFYVQNKILSGMRYVQVVKRSGIEEDKLEEAIGSFGPSEALYTFNHPKKESPSGFLARSGTHHVHSRVVDDDGEVFADWEWSFKLTQEW